MLWTLVGLSEARTGGEEIGREELSRQGFGPWERREWESLQSIVRSRQRLEAAVLELSSAGRSGDVYRQATATALQDELGRFRWAVAREDRSTASLPELLLRLWPRGVALQALADWAEALGPDASGPPLLDALQTAEAAALEPASRAFRRVQRALQCILLLQCKDWAVFGSLARGRDFFVRFEGGYRQASLVDESRVPQSWPRALAEHIHAVGTSLAFLLAAGRVDLAAEAQSWDRLVLESWRPVKPNRAESPSFEPDPLDEEMETLDVAWLHRGVALMHRRLQAAFYEWIVQDRGLEATRARFQEHFLQGAGDLYSELVGRLQPRLARAGLLRGRAAAAELNEQFVDAHARSTVRHEPVHEWLSLVWMEDEGDPWRGLRLHAVVRPPLNALFDAEALLRYNRLFSRFLMARRALSAVREGMRVQFRRGVDKELRRMARWLDELQTYQARLLRAKSAELTREWAVADSVDALFRAHEAFVGSLLTGCFLAHPPLASAVDAMLDLCIAAGEAASARQRSPDLAQFARNANLVSSILSSWKSTPIPFPYFSLID